IVLFSVFQYLTLGPSSPFFVYFIFSLFCGTLRWQWRGTIGTALVVLPLFVIMGASMSRAFGAAQFETNRFVIRTMYLAVTAAVDVTRHPPGEIDPVVPPPLADAVILCAAALSNSNTSLVKMGGATSEWHGLPLHAALMPRLRGTGIASAPFHTELVSGRVFFSDLGNPTSEVMSLTEVVGREIGASTDQLHVTEQLKEF